MVDLESLKRNGERLRGVSPLAWTASDHLSIGSTPPEDLAASPGKTHIDLWDDKQIESWLQKIKQDIDLSEKPEFKDNQVAITLRDEKTRILNISIKYLNEIGRLPEIFKHTIQ